MIEEKKKNEILRIKSRMMVQGIQKAFKDKAEQTKQDLLDLDRLDSQVNLVDLNAFDESENDKDQREEDSMKKLRKQILQQENSKNQILQNAISITSDSTNLRTKTDQNLSLERHKSTEVETNKAMKKLAYALTDDAIQKEKFFKIVKDVIRGSMMGNNLFYSL
jgi:hypothetical protein